MPWVTQDPAEVLADFLGLVTLGMYSDPSLLEMFRSEADVHLGVLADGLLALERDPRQSSRYEPLMRAAHSIKGAARIVGIEAAVALSHIIEDCFVAARDGRIEMTSSLIDVLLPAVDLLTQVSLRASEAAAPSATDVDAAVTRVREAFQRPAPVAPPPAAAPNAPVRSGPAPTPQLPSSPAPATPVPGSQRLEFVAEAREHLAVVCDQLLNLERSAGEDAKRRVAELLRATHTIKGGAGYLGCRTIECIAHRMESVLEAVGGETVAIDSQLVDVLLSTTDLLTALLDDLDHSNDWNVESHLSRLDETLARQTVPGSSDLGSPALTKITPQEPAPLAPVTKRPSSRGTKVVAPERTGEPAAAAGPAAVPTGADAGGSLRIPVSLVDRLMTLAGELVLVRNQTRRFREGNQGIPGPVLQRLDSVTSEFQEVVLQTRMQPVSRLFGRFPRLVRDLARQLGKQVELEVEGTEVELDKSILDALADPLTHLVRNACDHGLETPEAREAAGKPRQGVIRLTARHLGDQIAIEISDDGRGIDRERVRRKAEQSGLRSSAELTRLTDQELLGLILLPGFSTASQVTDLSGRGVGLDVVKTNVEQQGGGIEIASTPGRGVTFTLRLPLTLAILPCLLVSTSGRRYAIPQRNLEELVCLRDGQSRLQLERTPDQEFIRLRGRLLPLVRLSEVLDRSQPFDQEARIEIVRRHANGESSANLLCAVVRAGSQRFGIAVDAVESSEEVVVKPMHGRLRRLEVFSGATILGDGQVALILNAEGIARHAAVRFPASAEADARLSRETVESPSQPALLLRHAQDEQLAIPLAMIRRLVLVARDQIEWLGGQPAATVEGRPLRLIRFEDLLPIGKSVERPWMYILLPRASEAPVGFLAQEILDTELLSGVLDPSTDGSAGVLGRVVLRDRITRVLDLSKLLVRANVDRATLSRATPSRPASSRGDAAPPAPRRILLVEDTLFFRDLVSSYLQDAGYEVQTAEHGAVGLERLSSNPFDLVISDLEMPVMDGWTFATSVRQRPSAQQLPLLALTTLSGDADRRKALEHGFDAFEVKVDRASLLAAVERLLARSRVNDAAGGELHE